MNRNGLLKFAALILASLILISSSGLTLDVHYCQGKVKRVNPFGKARTCAEMANLSGSCHGHQSSTHCSKDQDHGDCCNNEQVLLDWDFDHSDLVVNAPQSTFDLDLVLPVVVDELNVEFDVFVDHYRQYEPPLILKDFCVLFESFLI